MTEASNDSGAITTTIEQVAQRMTNKHCEMELLLLAAPQSIALLAQLTLLATSVTDSPLKPPADGFKYIKYEGSFRACLHQLVNTGYTVFNNAQTKIQKISAQSSYIPGCISKIIECLLEGEPEDIADAIPGILQEIEEIAVSCVKLAEGTEKEFEDLLQFTHEIAEACTNTASARNREQNPLTVSTEEDVSTLLREISALDISHTRIDKVQQFLQDGLQVLSSVRTQWQNLVHFYNSVVTVIKINLQESFSHYAATLQAAQKRLQTGRGLTKAAKDTLHFHAVHISTIASHVHMISVCYSEVSRKHLIGRLLELGELIGLDPAQEVDRIKKLQSDIYESCIASQNDIEQSAANNRPKVLSVYREQLEKLSSSVTDISNDQQSQFIHILQA